MTREEAINILKQYIDYDNADVPDFYTMEEACEVVIKALEQEPCEDCISREAVIKTITEWFFSKEFQHQNAAEYLRKRLDELSPVTTQPKMGRWFIDERPESDREVICSNCDQPIFKYHKLDFDYRPKYCPNCGAKMSEIPTVTEGSEE